MGGFAGGRLTARSCWGLEAGLHGVLVYGRVCMPAFYMVEFIMEFRFHSACVSACMHARMCSKSGVHQPANKIKGTRS